MTKAMELAEGFKIFDKYSNDIAFRFDIIRVLVDDEISPEDENRLADLNWEFDSEERDYCHY